MNKTSALTSTDTKRILRTGIADALNELSKLLKDPMQNTDAKIQEKIQQILIRLLTLVEGQVPNFDFSKPAPVPPAAKADDGIPNPWRSNLDYGERK